MSCQINCGKCGVLFDKEPCARRRNDHYRSCRICRDKINKIYKKRTSVEPEPIKEVESEQQSDFNWKAVVFSGESKSPVQEETDESDEAEKSDAESDKSMKIDAESDTSMKSDANSINKDIMFKTESIVKKLLVSMTYKTLLNRSMVKQNQYYLILVTIAIKRN